MSFLEKTPSIANRLKKDWIENKENHLENGLVDIGAATNLKFHKTNVKSESKKKFQVECKQFVIAVLLKINERSLMQFSIVQNARYLDPVLMARFPEVSSQRFTNLAETFFALNKVSANIANKLKSQRADLFNVACFEHKEKFLDFKMKSDHVGGFLMDLLSEKCHADLLVVIKIIYIYLIGRVL